MTQLQPCHFCSGPRFVPYACFASRQITQCTAVIRLQKDICDLVTLDKLLCQVSCSKRHVGAEPGRQAFLGPRMENPRVSGMLTTHITCPMPRRLAVATPGVPLQQLLYLQQQSMPAELWERQLWHSFTYIMPQQASVLLLCCCQCLP